MTFLFPFLEQTARFDALKADYPSGGGRPGKDDPTKLTVGNPEGTLLSAGALSAVADALSLAQCPSDNTKGVLRSIAADGGGGSGNFYGSNIRFSHGDAMWNTNRPSWEQTVLSQCSHRGAFSTYYKREFGFFSDGLSNTIFASESVIPTNPNDDHPKRGVSRIDEIFASNSVRPAECLARAYDPNDRNRIRWADGWGYRGWGLCDGRYQQGGFSTVIQPNGPSCKYWTGMWNNWGIYTATSNHTGGVNGVFGDGSVRFISDSIDNNAPLQNGNYSGQSPYGVWGALGTPAGGESKSL